MLDNNIIFMKKALELAELAKNLGEVPVGALLVVDDKIVGEGFNRRELMNSCLEHAEIAAIKDACTRLGRWRLNDATLYVTLEPCIMCAGALLHARIQKLVFGAVDPKFGAIESLYKLNADPRLNHSFSATGRVLEEESVKLLRQFFKYLRENKKPAA